MAVKNVLYVASPENFDEVFLNRLLSGVSCKCRHDAAFSSEDAIRHIEGNSYEEPKKYSVVLVHGLHLGILEGDIEIGKYRETPDLAEFYSEGVRIIVSAKRKNIPVLALCGCPNSREFARDVEADKVLGMREEFDKITRALEEILSSKMQK